ncbi:cell division suppressor protein YneA [Anaerosalibacter sp. Marseille-P3206]|uniref:cell division suppressor protein YneA n=1 Tax=Anaerosalibacter sp. Marseille-P3206 TaxID=1871005 RepID=UPI000985156F|nr:LysM peptidoglycan-binding domain-containing protein [Anaerosalibacter sp. Marseille-P3206]
MKKKKIRIANKKRFIVSILFIISISLIITIILTSKNKVYSSKYEKKYVEVTIKRGDTLWSIALNNKPENYDTREIVYEIMMANNLEDSNLNPGDVIKVPIKNDK